MQHFSNRDLDHRISINFPSTNKLKLVAFEFAFREFDTNVRALFNYVIHGANSKDPDLMSATYLSHTSRTRP